MKTLCFAMLFCFFFSCKEEIKMPYTPPENVLALIAGDTGKTWMLAKRYNGEMRMNMGDCFMGYRQTFFPNMTVKDNNGTQVNCGSSLEGTWEITTTEKGNYYIKLSSEQIPELMGKEEEHLFYKLRYVSQDSLTLSFVHKQYGTKRVIVDHMVTENVRVEDRDFHWD